MQSAYTNLTEAARSVQVFRINGHAATKEFGGCIASRKTTVDGHDWVIAYHPTGGNANGYGSDMLRLRLTMSSEGRGRLCVPASFACRLVDQGRRLAPSKEATVTAMFYKGKEVAISLMKRSELESSGFLKDDSFLLQCTISVLIADARVVKAPPAANVVAVARVPSVMEPSSDLHRNFGDLLKSKNGADVTFVVSGETFSAHRCVLAARSPVFMAELFGGMQEKASQCIEIRDMEAEAFRALLHFIYTDTLPELEQLQEEQATIMAQHLLDAADRYGLERLKRICLEKACSSITVDTVATTLALAEQHGCWKLKARCMEFVLDTPGNIQAVVATEGYKHLMASCPSVLTDLLLLMDDAKRHKKPKV